jgi:hypothetical protein
VLNSAHEIRDVHVASAAVCSVSCWEEGFADEEVECLSCLELERLGCERRRGDSVDWSAAFRDELLSTA